MQKVLIIHLNDNVATALTDIKAGETIMIDTESGKKAIYVQQSIPLNHKISVKRIKKDSPVIKYGEQIGIATSNIEEGEYVHIHNVKSARV